MKRCGNLAIFILMILATSISLYAHGVSYKVIRGGIGIQAQYDDGQPISYSSCKIFAPSDMKTPYQQGLTDKYGRFLFVPDSSGEWKIEVDDGMGHGLVKKIAITKDMTLMKGLERKHLNRYQDILIGISIIFGITGIAFYFAGKKNAPKS